jgi:hypothetical protein
MQVIFDVVQDVDVVGPLVVLQRIRLGSSVNLTQIVETRVCLGRSACVDEVGYRDCGQKADNGHYDHELNQGEPGSSRFTNFHAAFSFYLAV